MAAGKGSALPSPTKGGGEGEGGSAKRENDCSAIFKPQDVVFGAIREEKIDIQFRRRRERGRR